uniref:Uncharacterized protein n=1 Tax=Rhizophora mucronata TaxID=61149 RepID=A0A2P2QCH8_RHIMU
MQLEIASDTFRFRPMRHRQEKTTFQLQMARDNCLLFRRKITWIGP